MGIKLKHKRGIRIQTRIIVCAILMLIQIGALFMMVYNISLASKLIQNLSIAAATVTVIFIVNRRGNPSYKIAWIIFILVFPIFGISVFLLWGSGSVFPFMKRRMTECESHYIPLLKKDPAIHNKLNYHDFLHARQADYLYHESGYPLFSDSTVEYLSPGEKFLPRFLEELRAAQKYIYLEFFIIAEGNMWEQVNQILVEKVKSGVEVKVLFDDFGSIKRQHKDFITRLQNSGIEVAVFNKITPSPNIFVNNRNHKKVVVIDGKVAVTGGLNLADEYINELPRFGYWMDCAVIIKGDATKSFLAMFCSTWEFTTGKKIDMESHIYEHNIKNDNFVLPYSDDPLNDCNPAEGIYMQILNSAQKYVYITTPYLILDSTMIRTLSIAAKSGIDVKIITPHIPDKWYVHPVTQYNYLELLEAGVKIYEYTPGFIHSKIFVSDDTVATVGTVNMDYRSFMLHFECGVWMSCPQTAVEIKEHFLKLLDESQEIVLEKWRKRGIKKRLKQAILHVFAPFM
ncbi:MAG: cardiolipin synthase [Clostridia bacterium]|nr:cardiolipin synthase [Clostridia bacterium]